MTVIEIIFIGVALSMDACALTIANCTTYKNSLTQGKSWAMPITFALFQGIMPLIGFLLGSTFSSVLSKTGGFFTAAVFYVLCLKIVFDEVKGLKKSASAETTVKPVKKLTLPIILLQGLATSIDALLIGVTLSFGLNFNIIIAVLIIALTTFILVATALLFGKYLGKITGRYAGWTGAVILFVLATKSLIEALLQ